MTGINCENMKSLVIVFENLFKKDKTFPIDLEEVPEDDLKKAMGFTDNDNTEVKQTHKHTHKHTHTHTCAHTHRHKHTNSHTGLTRVTGRGRGGRGAVNGPASAPEI